MEWKKKREMDEVKEEEREIDEEKEEERDG